MTKKFTINKKGVHIYFLQKILAGKNISEKSFRPGFQVVSLEPVQVTEFLMNGQKVSYEWEKDKVYIKQPITENGNYRISLNAVDAMKRVNVIMEQSLQYLWKIRKIIGQR